MSSYDRFYPPGGFNAATQRLPVTSCPHSSAVLLYRLFDARAALGEILQRHGRPHRELRIEREKERLRDGGQLRRLLHVEEDVPRALAIVFGEIGRFGLELAQYLLQRGAQRSFPYRVIASLNRYGHLQHHPHGLTLELVWRHGVFGREPGVRASISVIADPCGQPPRGRSTADRFNARWG